ncbi:MAG TPA: hypothetical protein VIN03_22645 [Roseateles sp.]
MTPEQQAYLRQWHLEQQRANNAAMLQAQQAQLNALRPTQPVAVQPVQPLSTSTGVSAFWTGKSQPAQSVTGTYGTNCEYNYAGRTFWRMFTGFCPSSVQVQ